MPHFAKYYITERISCELQPRRLKNVSPACSCVAVVERNEAWCYAVTHTSVTCSLSTSWPPRGDPPEVRDVAELVSKNYSFRCSTSYIFSGCQEKCRYNMSSRKITIITSPQAGPSSLPNSLSAASTPTKTTSVYRIEERSRTIYVAGDVDPTQWDTHSLNAIFALAEVPEDNEGQDQPIRRAYSGPQLIVTPESTERSDDSTNGSPRSNLLHSRRPRGARNTNSAPSRMSIMPPYSLQQLPPLPKRILFYHKHNPHYGFTNFSSHPVVYNGKRYPTSEHLFQSFKVLHTFFFLNGLLIIFNSSCSIVQI